jgi:hypothetical protein
MSSEPKLRECVGQGIDTGRMEARRRRAPIAHRASRLSGSCAANRAAQVATRVATRGMLERDSRSMASPSPRRDRTPSSSASRPQQARRGLALGRSHSAESGRGAP